MLKWGVIAALALLVFPSAAFAAPGPSAADRANAVRDCRALRESLGVTTFRQTYGTAAANRMNAFGRCVSRWSGEELENRKNAAQECAAERADAGFAASHGGKTFEQFYGTNANGRNAFGVCVSRKRRAESAEDREATLNAAQQCKAMRADAKFAESHGGKTFAEFFGTNENDRNAFGKCVSTLAKAQNDD